MLLLLKVTGIDSSTGLPLRATALLNVDRSEGKGQSQVGCSGRDEGRFFGITRDDRSWLIPLPLLINEREYVVSRSACSC